MLKALRLLLTILLGARQAEECPCMQESKRSQLATTPDDTIGRASSGPYPDLGLFSRPPASNRYIIAIKKAV